MGDKYWWEKDDQQKDSKSNVKGTAKDNGGQGYWWESGSIANMVGSNISNRVNNWLNNHNTYISDYQKRNSGRKYTYEDAYVSDSASWLDTVSKRKSESDAEADSILSYMDQYKDYLDADWMKSVRETITGARGAQSQILDIATADNEWWKSFGSEDLVSEYGSAEAAYKANQRYSGYSKKYTGKTADELYAFISDMDDGEEKDWVSSYASTVKIDEQSNLDIGNAERELEDLSNFYDEAVTIGNWYDVYKVGITKDALDYDPADDERKLSVYNRLMNEFGGDINAVKTLISKKKAYLNQAKYIQKGNRLAGVGDASSEYYDPEFGRHTEYIGGEIPLIPDYNDIVYGYINGDEDAAHGLTLATGWRKLSDKEKSRLDVTKHMEPEEKAVYNYYYNKYGYEAAEDYLDTIIEKLNSRSAAEMFKPIEGNTLAELAFGIYAGLDQFNSGITNLFSTDDYIPVSAAQQASHAVRNDLKDVGFKFPKWMGGASIGQGVYDVVTTTANMAPSIMASSVVGMLNPVAGAAVGSVTMGASAAGNAYQEALNLGYDKWQARAYSTLIGASEAGLQYLMGGVGKLGGKLSGKAVTSLASKFDNVFARLAVKYGANMLSEGAEEYLQEILTPVFKNLALNTDEEINLITEDAIYSFLLGIVTSGFMEGTGISSDNGKGLIGNLWDISSKNKANVKAATMYGDVAEELVKEGLASNPDSESYKIAEMLDRKIKKGKSITGYEIRQLVNANDAQFAVENYEEALPIAKKRLEELGETKNVDKIAKLVAKRATGQELTATEKSTLVRSQYGAKVAKEMTPDANEVSYKPLEDRIGTKGKFTVSEDGQTKIRATNEAIDLSNVEVEKAADGQLTIKLEDGRAVSADDIDFSSEDQSYMLSAVSGIENITPAAATAMVHDIVDPSKPLGDQFNGLDEAYTYGYHGYSVADLKAGDFTSNLTSEQMMSAYKLGQSARMNNIEAKDAPRVRMRTAMQAKLTAKEKTAQQKARFESNETEVYFVDGENTSKFDGNVELDDKRMAAVNYAKLLSKMGIGGKYYFFKSYVNAAGVRVYKDANGKEVEAPNGMYKASDGSIYIDLNAGDKGQGTALFTLGHELTHFIKQWSEKKFKVLADFLMAEYGKTDVSMRDRVNEKRTFLEEKRGEKVSYDEAYEEVVADAMSTMLADGNLHEKLAKLKATDKGLFNKIKQFFSNMIAKFQAAYKGLTPEQQAARDVRDMKDSFDRIQQAFAEALVEASDNFHAAMESVVETDSKSVDANEIITDGAVVTDGNGEKYSIRSMKHDIAEGKMFEDLKNVCGWTDSQVDTLRTQLTDLVEYMTPHRSILDMNESYGREGRRFSPYKPNSDPLYKISMDFSTLCSKRLLTQYVIENLQLRENRPMSAEEQMAIRDMLNEYRKVEKGLQVACAMCYVEAARLKSPKQIQRWLDDPTPHLTNYFAQKNTEFNDSVKKAQADFKESKGYDRNAQKKDMKPADVKELNKIGPRLRSQYKLSAEEQAIVEKAVSLPNSTYLTAANLANLSETDPTLYAAYTSFVRTATRSKSLETDEPYYYGDSSRDNGNGIIVSDSFIEAVNKENGMRFSSWSDWRIHHMLDYITAVIDNSVRGAAMHGYTKFGDEVRVLGKTGMMFNMSGVAGSQNGLNKDGSLNFSETESIDVNEAIQLREEFPETAGLQCIGVSPEHITALLRSDIIDYVIPYHVSGLNAALRRMADIHGWKDFTGTQHASIDKSIKFEDAVDKEHWHEEPTFSEFFVGYDTGMSGIDAMKESAERYKQMCKDRGLTPKFEQFASEDNYWKLLIDRKMINQQTGNLIRQKAVTPTFDFNVIKGVVDKFVDNYDAGLENRALNHIVENWDSIPQRIKDLKKQSGTKAKKANKAVNTLANQTVAAQPNDGTKFSERETDFDDTLDSHLDLTQDIYYPKTGREISVFNRQYINKTNGLKSGKIRYITIYTGSNVYAVRACGTHGLNPYIGKILTVESLDDHYHNAMREELKYGFDENRKRNDSPSDEIRYNRRRGDVGYRSVKERLKAEGYDYLFEDESSSFRDGNRRESGRDSGEVKSSDQKVSNDFLAGDKLKGNYTVSDISEMFDAWNSDPELADLSKKVFAKLQSIQDEYTNASWGKPYGIRFATNEKMEKAFYHAPIGVFKPQRNSDFYGITYNIDRFKNMDDQQKAKVLLHEAIHACTVKYIESVERRIPKHIDVLNFNAGEDWDQESKAALTLIQTFEQVRTMESRTEYGQKDVYEMTAELSNPEFRDLLKKQKLWDRVVNAIKRIFGIEQRTAYDAVSNALEKILELDVRDSDTTRYSDRDSKGTQLTNEQQEFFRDSQVRDENGNLLIVYHSTDADFTVFEANKDLYGELYYFAKSKTWSKNFHKTELYHAAKHTLSFYLNLKKPFDMRSLPAVATGNEWIEYFESAGIPISEKFREFWSTPQKNRRSYGNGTIPQWAIIRWDGISGNLRESLVAAGYDGIVIKDKGFGSAENTSYVCFEKNQIKRTNNKKPTSDPDIRYSERGDGVSNRSLLANAFEGITQNSDEYKMIQEYKGRIKLLNEQEEKLDKLNAEIRKIRFGTEGARDTAKLAQLEAEAKNTAKAINRQDKKLLALEASEPLRKVIERERKKEAQKTKDHVKEIQQNKKVRAEQTELRHKIRKTIRDLDKILNRGNKKQNVKEDLQPVVTKALQSAEILFTDNYGSYDMLRNGFSVDLSDSEESLVKTCTKMLRELDKMPTDGYENWQARQEAENRLKTKMSKLKDVFARERKRLNNTKVSSILGELADAYKGLETSDQSYVQGAYSEPVYNFLKNLQSEVGGTIINDMSNDQLESIYAAYKMVLNTVRNANKMFNEDLKQSREQLGNAVINEVLKAGGVHLLGTKMGDAISQFDWNNTKPIWVANRIGSDTFGKLLNGLFKGQYNFAVDISDAKKFKLEMDKKYRPRDWDAEKQYKFQSSTGKEFSLNLQQIMSLYAFSKRAQSYSHLLNGGFVFEDNATVVVDGKLGIKKTYIHKGAASYKLNEATLNGIINSLTAEQKAYVDEMQKYLSDVMGAKGNEVSMQLYGIKMFNEQFYFPLRSSGAYLERAKEAEMKKQQGQINLVNSGFTHAVKPEARNPIVLSGFMDVWAEHCNEMSMYHSMVLPMEDFRKVYNYSTIHDEKMESASVYQTIQDAYGKAATNYIDQLYRELNAGATVDPREAPFKKLISNFKKSAVMLSGSVVVQQFSSIGRAYAVIDPKYFIGTKVNSDTKLSVVEEMKKYAPVAIIKEMGGFDTGTKGNAKSYIMAEEYGKGERIKALAKDEQYRGDIMGYLPAWADQKTWCAIWEAVKRETKAINPKMDVKSEEFLELAGERFSEVIEKTQVYDSVLARSANMRSKGNFMAMATAFMAEPTTTVNLLEDAIRSGKAKTIARAFGSVAVSIVLNNALASIVYAMRDDDEDETFLEKYFQSFTSGMIDDISPMSYYPFLKDVYSILQGYDVERSDMSVIADVRDALKKVVTLLGKDTSNMDDAELSKHYKQVNEVLMGLLDAGCSAFGVPVKNVRRDAQGIINAWNTLGRDISGESNATWSSFWEKVGAAAKDTIPIYAWTKDAPKTDKLYDAIMSGDKDYLDRLKSTYKTEDAYHSAVRKALRENDSRIHDAAQARYEGRTEDYKRIFREIQNEGKFSFDDIMGAVNSEESKIRTGVEPKKATSSYGTSDFVEAIALGDTKSAQAMKDDIIATKVANGKSQETAEKEFISSVTSSIGDAYSSGLLDKARAEKMLVEYAGKDEEEAASRVSYWAFCEAHKQYKDVLTESNVNDYREFAEPANISVDVFVQFINGIKGVETKYDEWGDVEVSKRDQVLEVIDSLPLTWQQKDALYLATEYAESKIWDVPW